MPATSLSWAWAALLTGLDWRWVLLMTRASSHDPLLPSSLNIFLSPLIYVERKVKIRQLKKRCRSALLESLTRSPLSLFPSLPPSPPPSGRGLCMAMERTYIMAKPDAVQRGIVSDIVGRFEKKGYKLVALKLVKPPRSLLEEHYESLKVSRKRKRERRRERGKR